MPDGDLLEHDEEIGVGGWARLARAAELLRVMRRAGLLGFLGRRGRGA
jgi:hypothetical protein